MVESPTAGAKLEPLQDEAELIDRMGAIIRAEIVRLEGHVKKGTPLSIDDVSNMGSLTRTLRMLTELKERANKKGSPWQRADTRDLEKVAREIMEEEKNGRQSKEDDDET